MKILDGNAFKLRITCEQNIESYRATTDMGQVDSLLVNFVRRGRSPQTSGVDSAGRVVISNSGDLAIGVYGVELTGYYNGAPWRFYADDVFEITNDENEVSEAVIDEGVPIYDVTFTLSLGGSADISFVDSAIINHDNSNSAHPELRQELSTKVDDILVDDESVVETDPITGKKEVHFDSDNFGRVDDVKVNGVSVVFQKEANIELPSKVSQLQNDSQFTTASEVASALSGKQDTIQLANVDYQEDGGEPDASVEYEDGTIAFSLKNMKMKYSELTAEEKAALKGEKGDQGDSVIVGEGDLPLAHVLGLDNTKAISQKGITEEMTFYEPIDLTVDGTKVKSISNKVISGSTKKWISSSNKTVLLVKVTPGRKLLLSTHEGESLIYTFLTVNTGTTAGTAAAYPTGVDRNTTLAAGATAVIDIPNGNTAADKGNYLYLMVNYNGADQTPSRCEYYGGTVKDKISEIEQTLDETPIVNLYENTGQNNDGAMTQKAVTDLLEHEVTQTIAADATYGSKLRVDGTTYSNGNVGRLTYYALPAMTANQRLILRDCYSDSADNPSDTIYFYNENKTIISGANIRVTQHEDYALTVEDIPEGAVYIQANYYWATYHEHNICNLLLITKETRIETLEGEMDDVQERIAAEDADIVEVPEYYRTYIRNKCAEIFNKDYLYRGDGDSFIFVTDYHLPDPGSSTISQYRHSPALVRYIQRHTETKRFVFGGDITCSPSTDAIRVVRHRWFTEDFRNTNMMPVVGNHEWQNSDAADTSKGGTKDERNRRDFGQFCMNMPEAVFDTHKLPYYYWDNKAAKIRYFVLYAPAQDDASAEKIHLQDWQHTFLQAKAAELDNTWCIIVFQHIVITSSILYSEFDENGEPVACGHQGSGNKTRSLLNTIQADPTMPRVKGLVTGHAHFDFVEYESGYPVIVTTCDASYHWMYDAGDDKWESKIYPLNQVRIPNTINEQAFDVMHVDLDGNKWDLTRIGYGRNRIIRMTSITVAVGEAVEVTPTIPVLSGDSYYYQIRDTSKATVNNGIVTGVAAGKTVLKIANAAAYANQTVWEYVQIIVTA